MSAQETTLNLQETIARLNTNDRQELAKWMEGEANKAKVQASVHSFTDMCWKKCITSKVSTSNLSSSEESCLVRLQEKSCVDLTNLIDKLSPKIFGH